MRQREYNVRLNHFYCFFKNKIFNLFVRSYHLKFNMQYNLEMKIPTIRGFSIYYELSRYQRRGPYISI